MSTSTSSALTSRSEEKANARFSETNVLPSPGRELVTMMIRLRVLVAGLSAGRPCGHQIALDQPEFLRGARALGRRNRNAEAGELAAIEGQLGAVEIDGIGGSPLGIGRWREIDRRLRRPDLRRLALAQQRRRAFDQSYRLCHYEMPTEWRPKLNTSNAP